MNKIVQKFKWNLDGVNTEMYMYGEADFEANKAMQEPLEKLYQYENRSDIKRKIEEYISELEMEIERLEDEESTKENYFTMKTLQVVINGLKSRLEEKYEK